MTIDKKFTNADWSVLYRCSQKHYDRILNEYGLGYTQFNLLIQINENEGITMNELAGNGGFDKGTITKAIQKLEQTDFVKIVDSPIDKRSKCLYSSDKAKELLPKLYLLRQNWFNYLSSDLSEEDVENYYRILSSLSQKALYYNSLNEADEEDEVMFYGLQKLTLLDFPGHMAATVFTGGCNFRCPFCHNRSLVFFSENDNRIETADIFAYLQKRKGILDGVCVSGGEPLLHRGIKDFIIKVRSMGLKIKLDTNGTNFELLKELIDEKLVDYVAMDIKNCPSLYGETTGVNGIDLSNVRKSVKYLIEDHVDYEFRTTVVKEFHSKTDTRELGEWIKGAKRYYLQGFEDHGSCICEGLHPLEKEEMIRLRDSLKKYVENIAIRGIEE